MGGPFGVTFYFDEKFGADCSVYSTEVDPSKWKSGTMEQGFISCVLQETEAAPTTTAAPTTDARQGCPNDLVMDTMLGYGDYDMVQEAGDMTSMVDCINHAKSNYKD